MSFIKNVINQIKKISNLDEYDTESIKGIMSISIPKYKPLEGISSPVENIEYILQRKATEYKKSRRMDLAIACLRKSNEIMPCSNFTWSAKDYLRLVEFLKLNGQFEEARQEEKKLRNDLPLIFNTNGARNLHNFKLSLESAKNMGTDLLLMSSHGLTCEECSKYQGRIYSISGRDERFPKLPDIIFKFGCFHEGCRHIFLSFVFGINTFMDGKIDPIEFSNRPFVDTRTEEQKIMWEKEQEEIAQYKTDKYNYDLIREMMPDVAPKSLNGFRRMKQIKSKNYIDLVEKVRDIGIEL